MAKVLDIIYTYKFINILTDSWTDQPAYGLGIIDENGKQLKKSKSLSTIAEKNALTPLHKLAFAVKRIVARIPFSSNKLLAYATAVRIIRESNFNDTDSIESCFLEHIRDDCDINTLTEEIANVVGSGNVALTDKPLSGKVKRKYDNVFDVDCDTFTKCRWGKKRFAKWTEYVDVESELGKSIKKFSYRYPKSPLILRHPTTDAMIYLKHGKR